MRNQDFFADTRLEIIIRSKSVICPHYINVDGVGYGIDLGGRGAGDESV